MKRFQAVAVCAVAAAIVMPIGWLQYRIIHDCGWMAFFHGAEWWWLFGYCQ